MRIAVILAAYAIKLWLRFKLVTPQQIIILQLAGFALIVLMLTIMGSKSHNEPNHEVYCPEAAQRHEAEELCEWKLRDARLGHTGSMRSAIA